MLSDQNWVVQCLCNSILYIDTGFGRTAVFLYPAERNIKATLCLSGVLRKIISLITLSLEWNKTKFYNKEDLKQSFLLL